MKRILITEDEEVLREVFKDELTEEGYDVLEARDAKGTLDCLRKEKADLLILDIKLPDMSGLKLLEQVRKSYPALPIIVCTAYDTFKTDYEIWAGHIADYIVKPVDLEVLKEKIGRIIG
jgi:DNA-binding response OmpR family regulator